MTRLPKFAAPVLAAALAAAAFVPASFAGEATAAETPAQALQKLKDGNQRFMDGTMEHPNLTPERRAELAEGQAPYAVIVGCADSRVSPELAFDAGPGDLFVIRVAGNVVGDYELASIEYAVAALKSPLVVVLGHESCGAVGAAVASETEDKGYDGHIHDLVEALRPAVKQAMQADPEDLLDAAVKQNAQNVVGQLENSKPHVGPAAAAGDIQIVPARYDLDTGEVTFMDHHHDPTHKHEGHDH